eukprot:2479912-Alexandrium_andersonii.AAC.1
MPDFSQRACASRQPCLSTPAPPSCLFPDDWRTGNSRCLEVHDSGAYQRASSKNLSLLSRS